MFSLPESRNFLTINDRKHYVLIDTTNSSQPDERDTPAACIIRPSELQFGSTFAKGNGNSQEVSSLVVKIFHIAHQGECIMTSLVTVK